MPLPESAYENCTYLSRVYVGYNEIEHILTAKQMLGEAMIERGEKSKENSRFMFNTHLHANEKEREREKEKEKGGGVERAYWVRCVCLLNAYINIYLMEKYIYLHMF